MKNKRKEAEHGVVETEMDRCQNLGKVLLFKINTAHVHDCYSSP